MAMLAQAAVLYGVSKFLKFDNLDNEKRVAKEKSTDIFRRLGVSSRPPWQTDDV